MRLAHMAFLLHSGPDPAEQQGLILSPIEAACQQALRRRRPLLDFRDTKRR